METGDLKPWNPGTLELWNFGTIIIRENPSHPCHPCAIKGSGGIFQFSFFVFHFSFRFSFFFFHFIFHFDF